MTHKNRKKLRKFMFLSAGCSLLRAEGFFCRLDVLPGSGIREPDGRKSASGSGIRGEQPGSYFLELRNHFFVFLGVKIL
jgi:hypothetical protein